jgi:c-di-GMP-binding flagellar brake protein YcgR
MDLQPVRKDEIELGKPLRWPVYDKNKKLLMQQGQIVQTARQLEILVENGLFRDPKWHPQRVVYRRPPPEPRKPETESKAVGQATSFASIKLGIGDSLHMQPLGEQGRERYLVRFIGYVEKRSILVTAPMADGQVLLIRDGQSFVLRAFSGKSVYAFNASVLRSCAVPYPYLHLSYPTSVQGVTVRKAHRVKVHVVAVARTGASGDQGLPCCIVDLSSHGAMVDAKAPLGALNDAITLALRLHIAETEVCLTLPAAIRNLRSETLAQGGTVIHHGVEFQGVETQDRMALQNFIYQSLIEGL